MPTPSTIVTLHDEDGDAFPVKLPGVYRTNRGADIEAAFQVADEMIRDGSIKPRGALVFGEIEYCNEVTA